MDLYHWKHTQH
uniref:Uncharacterized protein n=1 Tax=Rhizophora mucronata TaxID=61149 RepID=A0A2P2QMB9_RHIMU